MNIDSIEQARNVDRARSLKAATGATHERLDRSIMAARLFENRERYGLFVTLQHQFHREVDALHGDAALGQLLPDLKGRRRLPLIEQDLADLGLALPAATATPVFERGNEIDLPTALGWLYVAEGSKLGAAFLLMECEKLGFSETVGARHLAAAPGGRGLHWKTFTAALDAVPLSGAEEERTIAGARAAFARVQELMDNLVARANTDMRRAPVGEQA